MLPAAPVPLNMFLVCVNKRDVDVSNLWLLPRAPCWRWRRVSLETETERLRETGGETVGWPAYHHPSTSAFSGSASCTVRLVPFGSLFNTCVCPCVHRRLAALAEEHQNQVVLEQNQEPISWLFLKLLTVFSVFTHKQVWDVGACNCDLCASSVR